MTARGAWLGVMLPGGSQRQASLQASLVLAEIRFQAGHVLGLLGVALEHTGLDKWTNTRPSADTMVQGQPIQHARSACCRL